MPPAHTKLEPDAGVPPAAARAAEEMAKIGGSPSAQLKVAKHTIRQQGKRVNLTYKPHIGMRQRLRELARMEKQAGAANADS